MGSFNLYTVSLRCGFSWPTCCCVCWSTFSSQERWSEQGKCLRLCVKKGRKVFTLVTFAIIHFWEVAGGFEGKSRHAKNGFKFGGGGEGRGRRGLAKEAYKCFFSFWEGEGWGSSERKWVSKGRGYQVKTKFGWQNFTSFPYLPVSLLFVWMGWNHVFVVTSPYYAYQMRFSAKLRKKLWSSRPLRIFRTSDNFKYCVGLRKICEHLTQRLFAFAWFIVNKCWPWPSFLILRAVKAICFLNKSIISGWFHKQTEAFIKKWKS